MSSVPIGYFISVLILAGGTFYHLSPRKWPRSFHFIGLYVPINELPFYACIWLAGTTWLAYIEDDVNTPVGWVSFGLTILAALGVAVLFYRSLKAPQVILRALDDRLGEGWRAAVDSGMVSRLDKKLVGAALLGPFFLRRHDVQRIGNISYGDAGKRNLLDVYRHRSRPTGCPVFVHLHGGAFVTGRKNSQAMPLVYRLASQGWVCISANYRLSPTARFPDHLIDVKKVIAWIRAHAHEYGADPVRIIVAGSSAGGHLASMAALTANDPAFQPGFESVDTSVSAAISLYGYYGSISAESELSSSPLGYSAENAPPFFVAHGDQDTTVRVEGARRFVRHLRTTSPTPVVYAELPGAGHVFDRFHSVRNEAVVGGVEGFVGWVLGGKSSFDIF